MNHQHHPALTVVIPVWDRYVDYLDEAITTIDAQREEIPMRILVIDNASHRPLPPLRPGVDVHRLAQRVSVGAARNAGLDQVATPFVAFADADDLFPPGYFAFAVERLHTHPHVVAVGMRPILFEDSSGVEQVLAWPTDEAIAAAHRNRRLLALRGLLKEPSIVMSGSVFRVSALRRAGGYSDLDYGEDANLALILPFLGDVELHRSPNRRASIHPHSLSRNTPDRRTLEAVYSDARHRLRTHPAVPRWAKALLPAVALHHRRRINAALSGRQRQRLERLTARTLQGGRDLGRTDDPRTPRVRSDSGSTTSHGLRSRVDWSVVERNAPELADAVQRCFARRRMKCLATIRHDGWPRLSDTTGVFVAAGNMWLATIPSMKLADLRHDARVVVHCGPSTDEWKPSARVSGWARPAPEDLRRTFFDAHPELAAAETSLHLLTVDITEVVVTGPDAVAGDIAIKWWTPNGGLHRSTRSAARSAPETGLDTTA